MKRICIVLLFLSFFSTVAIGQIIAPEPRLKFSIQRNKIGVEEVDKIINDLSEGIFVRSGDVILVKKTSEDIFSGFYWREKASYKLQEIAGRYVFAVSQYPLCFKEMGEERTWWFILMPNYGELGWIAILPNGKTRELAGCSFEQSVEKILAEQAKK